MDVPQVWVVHSRLGNNLLPAGKTNPNLVSIRDSQKAAKGRNALLSNEAMIQSFVKKP